MIWVKRLVCFVLCMVVCISSTYTVAYAGDDPEYHSHLTDDEIKEIFSLNVDDIPNAWQWMEQGETFTIIEKRNNQYTYWWNVPNLQMTFYNMFYANVMSSGYGANVGKPTELGESADNAMDRYGFNIPSPTYMGERPLITMSILGVLTPDSIFDGFGRFWNFVWTGDIVSYPSDKDLDSLVYELPRDYDTAGATFYNWVKENWYDAIENIKPNQVLLNIADEDGMKDGKQWIAKNIIFDQGLDQPGLSADYITQELEEICGRYYGGVAQGILLTSNIEEVHHYERIMPYDLNRMNAKDAAIFGGVVDHRSEMQENVVSTGYGNIAKNVILGWILNASSTLSEASVNINSISNFTFMENANFDPMLLWDAGIIQLLLLAMLIALVFLAVKSAVKVVRGSASFVRIFIKLVCTFLMVGFIWAVGTQPVRTYDQLKSASTFVFNMGNVAFNSTEQVQELYGTCDDAKKENVNLWLPYFNVWTVYQTNHSILDGSQEIDVNDGSPEVNSLKIPKIGDVNQRLWSTVLADAVTTKESYSGNIYRMVDHFMAPRVELNDAESVDISVSVNENYTGNIQSTIHWGALPMQLLILFLVTIKLLLFLEFMFNMSFFIVNMSLSVNDGKQVVRTIKELFASMVNVAVANLAICIVIWVSLTVDGALSLILFAFFCFLIYQTLKNLVSSNGVFTPKILRKPVMLTRRFLMRMVSPTGSRTHSAPEDAAENDDDQDEQDDDNNENGASDEDEKKESNGGDEDEDEEES